MGTKGAAVPQYHTGAAPVALGLSWSKSGPGGHNKKLQGYSADFPSLFPTNYDFELTLTLVINTDFLSVPKVPSISTEDFVLLRHARCVPSRLRCKEHSLLLSSYQLIIGKIENPYCSACRHSSQDIFHFILSSYGFFAPLALWRLSDSL